MRGLGLGLGLTRRQVGGDTQEVKLLLDGDTDWRQQDIDALNVFFQSVRPLAPASGGLFIAPLAGPDRDRSMRGIRYTNQVPSLHTMVVSGVVEGDYSENIGFTGDGSSYYDTGFDDTDLGVTATSALMAVKVSSDGPGSIAERLCGRGGGDGGWWMGVEPVLNRGTAACLALNFVVIDDGDTARWFANGRASTTHRFNQDAAFNTIAAGALNSNSNHFLIGSNGSGFTSRQISAYAVGKVDATEANMSAFKAAFEAWETARAA